MYKTGAVILAASGMDQGFCPISIVDHEPMINSTIRMLEDCGIETVTVVTGDRHDILDNVLESSSAIVLYNDNHESSHMLDNIRLALTTVCSDCDRILIIRGDILAFSQDTVKKMLESTGSVIYPSYRNEPGHPLLVSSSFFQHILNYEGTDGLEGLLKQHPSLVTCIDVDDEGILLNNDSYENFQQILKVKAREKNERSDFHINVSLSIENTSIYFNDESAVFFQMIDKTKSIRAACKCLHFSYTKGWKMINRIESETGIKFVKKTVGGTGGGNTQLTPEGRQYTLTYLMLRNRLVSGANMLFNELGFFMKPREFTRQ